MVTYAGGERFDNELAFFFKRSHEVEVEGRIQRELMVNARNAPVVKEETKSPSPHQGPSMARSIDGSSRRP